MRLALFWQLTRAAWLDRYAASALGVGWAVLWPIVQLGIFLVVFGELMGARLEGAAGGRFGYGVYLASGMVPWWILAGGVGKACGAFVDSRGLLTKIALPLAWVPLPQLVAESLGALVLLGLLVGVLWALGGLTASAWWLVLVLPGLGLLAYGAGLIAAIWTVFVEDTREVVQVALQLGFWLTPVVYLVKVLPAWAQGVLAWNPAAWAVEAFHAALVFGRAPRLLDLAALWGVGLSLSAFGLWLLKRTEKALRDLL
ncbi:ABC transporter permease [Methylothermus subterraneus]